MNLNPFDKIRGVAKLCELSRLAESFKVPGNLLLRVLSAHIRLLSFRRALSGA
jgi:hypothetical protein